MADETTVGAGSNKLITLGNLDVFRSTLLNKLLGYYDSSTEEYVYGLVYPKLHVDDLFALKNGDSGQDFSANKLILAAGETELAYKYQSNVPYFSIKHRSGNTYSETNVPIGASLLTTDILDPGLVAERVNVPAQNTVKQFVKTPVLSKFRTLTAASGSTMALSVSGNELRVIGSTAAINDVVYVSDSLLESYSYSGGFYLVSDEVAATGAKVLTFVGHPSVYGLYYDTQVSKLCHWNGTIMVYITTGGGGGSVPGEYTIADDSEIEGLFNQ